MDSSGVYSLVLVSITGEVFSLTVVTIPSGVFSLTIVSITGEVFSLTVVTISSGVFSLTIVSITDEVLSLTAVTIAGEVLFAIGAFENSGSNGVFKLSKEFNSADVALFLFSFSKNWLYLLSSI